MATIVRDDIKVCACCGIAAANADVSGCEDYWNHAPHALSVNTEPVTVLSSFDWDHFECFGCGQIIDGQGFDAIVLS